MQQTLFQPKDYHHPKLYLFKQTKLGRIHDAIPWEELEDCLPVQDTSKPGPKPWFSNKGMFGLMFLKHLIDTSDEKLIDRFNTDWSLQLFCGKLLGEGEMIRDQAMASRVRGYMAEHADWEAIQQVLLEHWKKDMESLHILFMDATCYESYIRFPTDVKLLWECCQWIYDLIFKLCKLLGIKRPRNKFIDQKRKQQAYSKLRRKTYKKGRRRHRSLVYLLEKGLDQLQGLFDAHPIVLTGKQTIYLKTIKQVLSQQKVIQEDSSAKIPERIVSLHKPYIRPIVRGKENKPVEFGMKAHMLQSGGVVWFDKMEFKAFNECKALKTSFFKHTKHFGSCFQLAADRIYATNENRNFLKGKGVFHSFAPKGRPVKDTKQAKPQAVLRQELNKVRSTHLEGAFGNHKNHYGLRKVKALSEKTEHIWVFFGVMSANASKIADRKFKTNNKEPVLRSAA